jgi:hypothetical protein
MIHAISGPLFLDVSKARRYSGSIARRRSQSQGVPLRRLSPVA